MLHSNSKSMVFMSFPDRCELLRAVADLGQQWEKVSKRVGRMSADCRDRHRNHIVDRDIRISGGSLLLVSSSRVISIFWVIGPWTKEEEGELTQIVTDMTIKQGKDTDNDVFWGRVSELMGGRRGRQQCRIKWQDSLTVTPYLYQLISHRTDALSKTVKNEGQKPRWSQQDAYILVHK